jgi:hypothetical protein
MVFAATSCGVTDSTTAGAPAGPSPLKRISQFSLNDLRPSRIRIVDVREHDLKPLPLGSERAIAHESMAARSRAHSQWISHRPIDFVEPSLPATGVESGLGLLPPKPN